MTTDETIISAIDTLETEGEAKPYLTFIKGPRLGQIHPLEKGEVVVGRSPDCDLWIEDGAISRKHFRVRVIDNRAEIEDLGSTNGTYVNGEAVKKVFLNDGDKIQISQETILELTYLDESRSLSEKKLYEMGVMDPVTNIYNKRYLLDRIREEFSFARRKKETRLSLIIFDIDHFKTLNDTFGHLAGDVVLQKVCSEVGKAIRTDDIFARYGGEEFIIVMRDAPLERARDLAERIRLLVEGLKIVYEGKDISLTISCGISIFKETQRDYLTMIADADRCLYEAKTSGRNRISGP